MERAQCDLEAELLLGIFFLSGAGASGRPIGMFSFGTPRFFGGHFVLDFYLIRDFPPTPGRLDFFRIGYSGFFNDPDLHKLAT